ncbi:ABC-type glycerol-3-phosphate transport system substrate-binding protein [Anaerotaenia torta]|uniref:extracellular solute-binding protein n=1 Tax=Anaerotaenia torta TaxID=433293 RepID=UPI003D21400C
MGRKYRAALLCLAAVILAGAGSCSLRAGNNTAACGAGLLVLKDLYLGMENTPDTDYEKYLERYGDSLYQGKKITYPAEELWAESTQQEGFLLEESEEVQVTIRAEQAAAYVLSFDYQTLGENILPTNLALKVNGEYPYDELKRIFLGDTWISGEVQHDRYGNECLAMPTKVQEWKKAYIHDTAYLYSEPMLLYLEAGENILTFQAREGTIRIGSLYLEGREEAGPAPGEKASGNELIVIEAENMTCRNSPNIRAASEFVTDITPYDPKRKVLNMVAEESFKTGGTSITYEFKVGKPGYYNLAFDYRQSAKPGFSVYRNIYIDGRIPSAFYEDFAFPYAKKFARLIPEEEGNAIYLEEGMHTITLEVSLDKVRYAVKILNAVTKEMNTLALEVSKITGGNSDKYRDFDLEPYGFNIRQKLLDWAGTLEQVHSSLSELNPGEGNVGEIAQLTVASKNLRKLAEKPNELPKKLNLFSYGNSSARQSVNNVIEKLSVGQLGLDKLFLYQEDAKLPGKPAVIKKAFLSLKRLFSSFTKQDYAPTYDKDKDTLNVWVARPRQYLEIMQRMADADFTKRYGINVNLSIVPDQQKLILANASGKAPDAAIGISSGYVYDLALRGALENLRQYDNFKEVGRRFAPGMLIPGVCDDGIYALPETFNFYVLFYRTDILESLGLTVPDTMEEVRKMLPQLERMGLGFNTHVANFLVKGYNTTAPFIFQSGGKLMESGEMQIDLETPGVLGGMKVLTENFTIYDMDYEVLSFYQAFRDGRLPIGTSDYGTFNLLTNAAPELADAWNIAPYPGIADEEGNVLRYTSGAAESCVVFENDLKAEAAWKFLDWWTSTEVQTEFAFTLQSTLGNEYLWNSANLDAIKASPWSSRFKDTIVEQISWTYEAPRVPGGYIIERELGNVLVQAVTQNANLRSAVDSAQKKINRELSRKMEEFGYLDSNGSMMKELVVPDIQMIEEWLK